MLETTRKVVASASWLQSVGMAVRGIKAICAVIAICAACNGCATNSPRRVANIDTAPDPDCLDAYAAFDTAIWRELNNPASTNDSRNRFLIEQHRQVRRPELAKCWTVSYEHHPSMDRSKHEPYELFYAEFDDQGMPTDKVANLLNFNQTQIYLIETKLRELLKTESAQDGGINLVVFTHGWHGNATAANDYSTEFKAILQKVAFEEASDPKRKQTVFGRMSSAGNTTQVNVKDRLTVGIEIAWRGDSFEHPGIPFFDESKNALNIWDRKHAAETVAKGSVHELLAFLQQFYLTNSCNGESPIPLESEARCDEVHMLTLGHSLGALINFSTLISRIEKGLNSGCDGRAYAFGDLTVLLNPAFEGSRYAPIFETAMHHAATFGHYPGGGEDDTSCRDEQIIRADTRANATTEEADQDLQIPVLVTLQSSGDSATGTFFPIFKLVSTVFSNSPFDEEATDERLAAGWVKKFQTHRLSLQEGSSQTCYKKQTDPLWYCPRKWSVTPRVPESSSLISEVSGGDLLEWSASNAEHFPDYMPIWSIKVDASIMRDHDDIWNPRIVTFIAQLFRDAYDQADDRHYRRARSTSQSPGDVLHGSSGTPKEGLTPRL